MLECFGTRRNGQVAPQPQARFPHWLHRYTAHDTKLILWNCQQLQNIKHCTDAGNIEAFTLWAWLALSETNTIFFLKNLLLFILLGSQNRTRH